MKNSAECIIKAIFRAQSHGMAGPTWVLSQEQTVLEGCPELQVWMLFQASEAL